jgi:hypothetical protein
MRQEAINPLPSQKNNFKNLNVLFEMGKDKDGGQHCHNVMPDMCMATYYALYYIMGMAIMGALTPIISSL